VRNKKKQLSNLALSIKEQLLNSAKKNRVDFNSLLKQFFQERFLYRLSKSIYVNNFILKGALLFLAYDISRLRPTIDIDFKGQSIPNQLDAAKKIIVEIVELEAEDGVKFQKDMIVVERINEDADYEGIRIKIKARLGNIQDVVRIDIAFGDPIIHGPNEIEFPTILELEAPKIRAYSIESSIAEKLHAIVSLSLASSRMKDYYDILFFASNYIFILSKLKEAVTATFKYRNTEIEEVNHIFTESFKQNEDMNKYWSAFIKKRKINSSEKFGEAAERLEQFIKPILFTTASNKKWNPNSWSWE
jgi:predicted nucleotidyltransferase component of viral defense system